MFKRVLVTLAGVSAIAATAGCTAQQATHRAATVAAPSTTVDNRQACPDGEVAFYYDEAVGCDMIAGRSTMTIIFDADHNPAGTAEGWGGDASLANADKACADMGGRPRWFDGDRMQCEKVDF